MQIQQKLSRFPVPDFVWEEYWLDQEINDRGIGVDMEMVARAIAMDVRAKAEVTAAQSAIPLTPHLLYPQFMDDNAPTERWLARHKINYVLIGKCEDLWLFGNAISSGMEYEISVAKKRRMKIRYFTDELKEVMR